MNNNAVCQFIERNLLCPSGCTYNNNQNRCVSNNPNIVCELTKQLRCPFLCQLNLRGDICVGNSAGPPAICSQTDSVMCPSGCSYNSTANLCLPTIKNSQMPITVCEHRTYLSCPFNKYADNTPNHLV